jgi:hypothetical protein
MSSPWVIFGIEIGLALIGFLLALAAWELGKKLKLPED